MPVRCVRSHSFELGKSAEVTGLFGIDDNSAKLDFCRTLGSETLRNCRDDANETQNLTNMTVNTHHPDGLTHRRSNSWGSSPTSLDLTSSAIRSLISIDDNSVME